MPVISFRVDAETYRLLKARKENFKDIFEPIARDEARKSKRGTKHTRCIQTPSPSLYIDLARIQKDIDKLLKNYEGGKQ